MTELLIVIAIIAFLIGLLSLAYINQLKKARDGERKADLYKVRASFEDYFNDRGCYPNDGGVFENCGSEEDFAPWLSKIPCDAQNNYYKVVPEEGPCPTWFAIYTNLEYLSDPQLLANECVGGCVIDDEVYNFVAYSEGVSPADLPHLPLGELTPTPTFPPGATATPGGPTATPGGPTATPTLAPTATPTWVGPPPPPCSEYCYRLVSGECNGPLGSGDGPCTEAENCYTDSGCSADCWITGCNE